jgi:hypothetical protein
MYDYRKPIMGKLGFRKKINIAIKIESSGLENIGRIGSFQQLHLSVPYSYDDASLCHSLRELGDLRKYPIESQKS